MCATIAAEWRASDFASLALFSYLAALVAARH
jgi:hypothetical protein